MRSNARITKCYATIRGVMDAIEESLVRVYPNTCEECPERGEIEVFGSYFSGDMIYIYDHSQEECRWKNIGWPVRCKPCNAKAQAKKRANSTIHRLEELREMVQDWFSAHDCGEERWCYLKFVTLTWKNEWSSSNEVDMKAARKWLQKKRLKICDKLDVVAGTDVIEKTQKAIYDPYSDSPSYQKPIAWLHNVHSHGVWVMPYHPIKEIGRVMKKYVGRDQTRAIMPKIVKDKKTGREFTVSAFAQARNYIMKYLSKQPNTRRSSWGFVRSGLTADTFYGECIRINDKWLSLKK